MKILLLDIETAPNIGYLWSLRDKYIPIDRIAEPGYTMCWAAKWLGEDEVMFDSIRQSGEKKMIRRIRNLMDEADAIVHFNGNKFDIPTLNKEILVHNLDRPMPAMNIDLLKTVRSQFRFPSNKLDYVAQALGLGCKVKHRGFSLWKDCMAGNEDAWREMEEYNRQDVVLLESLYMRLMPWIKGHPNMGILYSADDYHICPHCGCEDSVKKYKGYSYTRAGVYQRYKCTVCKTPIRGTQNLAPPKKLMEINS